MRKGSLFFTDRGVISVKLLNKYSYIFKLGVLGGLEYRMNFLLSMFSAIFPILIQFYLWKAVFVISGNHSQFGYDYDRMISYVIVAGIIAKFVACGFEWEMNQDIKEGKLNNYIIKPMSYMQYRLWSFFGGKVTQVFILSLVLCILGVINTSVRKVLSPQNILLFVIALLLAMILNFLITYCVAVIAFWLQEVWGIFIIVNLMFIFVSGGIFPLDVFGKTFMEVVKWLPFKYIVYVPVSLLIGNSSGDMLVEGFYIPAAWILVLSLLSKFLWQKGMKNYISAGG